MAKETVVRKPSTRDAKRAQDKDDLETLEAKANQPVSSTTPLFTQQQT